MKDLIKKWNSISLIKRIICGLIIGLVLGLVVPQASVISILGTMFVGALKGIAPLLVFFLVMSALCHMKSGQKTNLKFIIILYMVGNLVSAFVAVIACRLFPVTLTFTDTASATDITPPSGIAEVLTNLLNNLVKNPVDSIVNANYIGILFWAVIFGIALKHANKGTKDALENISDATATAVQWIINCAPFGIMGLIFSTISEQGLDALLSYGKLILVLVGSMAVVIFIINPVIVFIFTKQNPFPLVFTCLKESFITAFFTRSSAANIPVNMELCKKLGLDEDTYSISYPSPAAHAHHGLHRERRHAADRPRQPRSGKVHDLRMGSAAPDRHADERRERRDKAHHLPGLRRAARRERERAVPVLRHGDPAAGAGLGHQRHSRDQAADAVKTGSKEPRRTGCAA